MSFIGKVILITGVSNNDIGIACAEFFAKKGVLLALADRNSCDFERVIEKIQASGVEMEPLKIIADASVDAERIINETIEIYNRLDVLINIVGLGASVGGIETATIDDYDTLMGTNVRAIFQLTQFSLPYLVESKGNIVNVSSVVSLRTAFKNSLLDCMSRAALDQFTKCTAMELAEKEVRINAVTPEFVDTVGIEKYDYADIIETSANKTHGHTLDCVNAISFLAKDSSSFITGVILALQWTK